ncbi:hypothetical protein GUJ93_ZPchr0009g2343 [Zizania palustris]|uniref:Uncharacterized protein n=1 Tax=Zizania palustris TaxID=103762 RepID=A0A8J5RLR7_ZIZPA|nr:hypothetical protein GUJ93_ZPchr0009g2343 [Zizania palustris]
MNGVVDLRLASHRAASGMAPPRRPGRAHPRHPLLAPQRPLALASPCCPGLVTPHLHLARHCATGCRMTQNRSIPAHCNTVGSLAP